MTIAHAPKRLISGILGQASGRVIVAVYQLAVIPFMIHSWGLAVYGEWLVITGVATYISVSNYGVTAASAMDIIRRGTAGDHAGANAVIAGSLTAMLVIASVLTAVAAALFGLTGLARAVSIETIAPAELAIIVAACGIQVGGASVRSLPIAVCDAQGFYGVPQALSSGLRLFEFAGTIALLATGHRPVFVACWMAQVIMIDCLLQIGLARRRGPWARFTPRWPGLALYRRLAAPTLGHTIISVAVNAISVQGYRLVIAATLGSAAVGVLGVYTALVRVTEHFSNMILPVIQLEFARAGAGEGGAGEAGAGEARAGEAGPGGRGGDGARAISLMRLSQFVSLITYLGYTLAVLLLGPWILRLWTAGQVAFLPLLFLALSGVTLFTQIGRTNLTLLMGRNVVGRVGLYMLIGWLVALALAVPASRQFGLVGAATTMILGEAAASLSALVIAAHTLGMRPAALFRTLLNARALAGQLRGSALPFLRKIKR